jgi:hypothetical protein
VQVASAQLPGIPNGPVMTGLGINVAANYGKPTNSGATGSAWGVMGGLGLANLGISASFGGLTPSSGASSQTTFAGAIGMKLFGGGLTPVTIGAQVGASHISSSGGAISSTNNVMPGGWVKVSPPLFPLRPWGQVYELISNNPVATGSTTKNETRIVVGADFNLLLGLGVHAGYDFGTGSNSSKFWGVGAHMTFRVPSLGVPGVPGI